MKDVEWGKEASAITDGLKGNFNIVLCAIEGEIPSTTGGAPTAVTRKLFFPKAKVGEWIKKHLTTFKI